MPSYQTDEFNYMDINMIDPRAFISFDFDLNENEKHLFIGQAKNSRSPFNIQDWSAKISMPESQWESIVEAKIKICDMLIVLVGKNTCNAIGVVKEIRMAHKYNVPVFGVYVGGANSYTNLPIGLSKNRVVDWSWDTIAVAIQQVLKERVYAQQGLR